MLQRRPPDRPSSSENPMSHINRLSGTMAATRIAADSLAARRLRAVGTPVFLVEQLKFVGTPGDLLKILKHRLSEKASVNQNSGTV